MAKKKASTKRKCNFTGIKPDVVVGLDLSITSPGWAQYFVASGELKSGYIDIEKMGIRGLERMKFLRDAVLELVEHTGKTVVVFIEGYSFASKGQSGIDLAEVGGAVRMALADMNIRYCEVPPLSLKKYVTGKGKGDKAVMLKELLKRFGRDIDQNDEGDAVCLVELGRGVFELVGKPLAQFQQEVISTL